MTWMDDDGRSTNSRVQGKVRYLLITTARTPVGGSVCVKFSADVSHPTLTLIDALKWKRALLMLSLSQSRMQSEVTAELRPLGYR